MKGGDIVQEKGVRFSNQSELLNINKIKKGEYGYERIYREIRNGVAPRLS